MLNIGVVGTGGIAAAHLAAYAAFPEECRVVALHDVVESRAHGTKAASGLAEADVSPTSSSWHVRTSTW